jgi:hypothetical protein
MKHALALVAVLAAGCSPASHSCFSGWAPSPLVVRQRTSR